MDSSLNTKAHKARALLPVRNERKQKNEYIYNF